MKPFRKIMKLFFGKDTIGKAVCKHKYKFYGLEPYYISGMVDTRYKFICLDCEKTFFTTKINILRQFDIEQDRYEKDIVLDKTIEDEEISFSVSAGPTDIGRCFSGVAASRMRNYFLEEYGIDVTECVVDKTKTS